MRLAALPFLLSTAVVLGAPAAKKQTREPSRNEPIELGSPDAKAFHGEKISLNLKDAELVDVLDTFHQLTGLNIVVYPGVRGTVTVSLKDVPWDQALDLILRSNGLGYVREGRVLRVGPVAKLME